MMKQRCRVARILWVAFPLLAGPIAAGDVPLVELRVNPCSPTLNGDPGTTFDLDVEVQISMLRNAVGASESEGIQGWSIGVAGIGLEVTRAWVEGTVSAPMDEDPEGLRNGGFERTELAQDDRGHKACKGLSAAVSAVVLSFQFPTILPLDEKSTVLFLSVAGEFPEEAGESRKAAISFIDGCTGTG
ncbi:MAG: hypothetical protein AAF517_15215 [Planctomycetota bacterium]